MRIKQIFIAFLIATLFIGCGKKAKDIDVNDLKTACEVVDAYILIHNELDDLSSSIDSDDGPSDKQKEKFESLEDKFKEIKSYRKKNFKLSRMKMCENWPEHEKKSQKIGKIAREKGLNI